MQFPCLSSIVVSMALALVVAPTQAQAQAFPSKPVSLVVPFTAGGPIDAMARLLAKELGERLGQQVVVENKKGAVGSIAAEYVAKAPADGYTLFFSTTGTMAINPSLYSKLRYDPAWALCIGERQIDRIHRREPTDCRRPMRRRLGC